MNRLLDLIDRIFPPKRYHHRHNGPVTINPDLREQIHVWGSSKGTTMNAETSARDELLNLHGPLTSDAQKQPEYRDNTETAIYGYSEGVEHALDTAWAKGYRKPRTITTVEELLALHMAVVRTAGGTIANIVNERAYCFGFEASAPAETLALPATVLYEPTPGGADLGQDWADGAQEARAARIEGEKR